MFSIFVIRDNEFHLYDVTRDAPVFLYLPPHSIFIQWIHAHIQTHPHTAFRNEAVAAAGYTRTHKLIRNAPRGSLSICCCADIIGKP